MAEKADAKVPPPAGAHGVPEGDLTKYTDPDSLLQLNSQLDVAYNLPITSSRNGTWFHSAFHNVTAIIGAGVLGLPYAFGFLGWAGGIVTLTLSWIISLYTLHQLCALHEFNGKRFNRYHELGQYAFGKMWGDIAVVIPQLIVMVGLGIAYSITGGKSLQKFWSITCEKNAAGGCATSFGQSAWIVVFGAIQLFLIQCPDFNSLTIVSLAAAVMSLTYSTIAIGGSIAVSQQPNAEYNLDGKSTAAGVFGIFNSLGIVAFAYGGHNVVLEIQATLPSPPPTYRPYMRGVYLAYAILSWCYFGVAITGYWAFGNEVSDNVLFSINNPEWMVALGVFAVFIHVIGSYQIYTMPVLDMIEMQMVKRRIPNGLISRLIYRSIYVCIITFVAVTLPFFGDILGFIGALGTGPTTFWIPSVIWLVLKKPSVRNWNFWASWVCIVLGVMVTVLGAAGGLRGIIVSASTYKFYQ